MNLKPVDFKAVAKKGAFVYCYLRKHDLTPYYIGFSADKRGKRPFEKHCVQVPEDLTRIRLMRSGLTVEEAKKWERFYVFRYGIKSEGGILRNLCYGGQTGVLGYKHTDEAKAKMSAYERTAESNQKRRNTQKGRPLDPLHAKALAKRNRENASTRQAASSQARRINTAKRLGVCPLIFGIATPQQHARIRARHRRGERDMLKLQDFDWYKSGPKPKAA